MPDATPVTRRHFERSYVQTLVICVAGLVLATGLGIIWLAQRSARRSTEAMVASLFREVSEHAVTHTQAFMGRAVPLVETLSLFANAGLALEDQEQLARQLLPILEANPGLSWVSYGDEQGRFTGVFRDEQGGLNTNLSQIVDGKTAMREARLMPDGSRQTIRTETDSGYDPRKRPFYVGAKSTGRLVWLPPYVFFNRGIPGVSCATPVYSTEKTLRGVLSVDFDLNSLSDFVSRLSLSPNSIALLLTPDGTLLAFPRERLKDSLPAGALKSLPTIDDLDDKLVQALARGMHSRTNSSGDKTDFQFLPLKDGGVEYLASTTKFDVGTDLKWVVAIVAPASDFLTEVWRGQRMTLIAAAAALVIALAVAVWMARSVSQPITSLIGFSRRVSDGDLEARAELGATREFRELSGSLNRMIEDLRDRLRLRHSLDVAMHVQQRLLPESPPQISGLDIAGHSTYCDETGGDYYDFIVVDEAEPGTVVVGLGDVMGHGIAAALVMAGVRAVLRDRATARIDLAGIMQRLNQLLAADFGGSRFMTMHLSLIDRPAGTFRWASAGHDPALIYRASQKIFEEVDGGGLPLGIDDDATYGETEIRGLTVGDVITIGTDGVWEMPNEQADQFGKDRLRAVIRRYAGESAATMKERLMADLNQFRGAARQVDDVTFAIIKVVAAE